MRTPRSGASASAGSWRPRDPHGRRAGYHRHAAVPDGVERGDRVEALHEDGAGAHLERQERDDRQAHDVVEREDAEHDVVGSDPVAVGRADLAQVGQQVAVREHRRGRGAGRAAREHQQGEGVALDVDRRDGRRREQLVEGVRAVEVVPGGRDDRDDRARHRRVDGLPRGRGHRPDHRGDRRDLRQLPLDLRARAGRVERHGHGAQPDRGQEGDDEVRVVAGQDGDAVAGPTPRSSSAPRNAAVRSRSAP